MIYQHHARQGLALSSAPASMLDAESSMLARCCGSMQAGLDAGSMQARSMLCFDATSMVALCVMRDVALPYAAWLDSSINGSINGSMARC
jgi:hypothetical protein